MPPFRIENTQSGTPSNVTGTTTGNRWGLDLPLDVVEGVIAANSLVRRPHERTQPRLHTASLTRPFRRFFVEREGHLRSFERSSAHKPTKRGRVEKSYKLPDFIDKTEQEDKEERIKMNVEKEKQKKKSMGWESSF